MTADEARKFGDEIATAIRARGLELVYEARRNNLGDRAADFIQSCFHQAAQVAEIRGIHRQIALLKTAGQK